MPPDFTSGARGPSAGALLADDPEWPDPAGGAVFSVRVAGAVVASLVLPEFLLFAPQPATRTTSAAVQALNLVYLDAINDPSVGSGEHARESAAATSSDF